MITVRGFRVSVAAGALAAVVVAAAATPSLAQEKVWRHGLIKAKADAGIFLMVATDGFAKKQGITIKTSEFRNDQLALKALIAGELDSFEGGPQGVFSANARGGDARILLLRGRGRGWSARSE